jgi:ketosteroid isomerase-like protein
MGRLQRPGSIDVKNINAEGEYVVVQGQAIDRITHDGRPYNNTYCLLLRLVDGKVVAVDEYCDTELITRAFGAKEDARAG